jgi:hypothetical protein
MEGDFPKWNACTMESDLLRRCAVSSQALSKCLASDQQKVRELENAFHGTSEGSVLEIHIPVRTVEGHDSGKFRSANCRSSD